MINIAKNLVEKIANMYEQREKCSRYMETIKQSNLKLQKNIIEMKNTFDGLNSKHSKSKSQLT